VTSIEFERMLSASGPFQGELKRPSDGKPPQRIAWIQCIGSRDASCNREYCSSVCCTYAIKEAVVAKEHVPHELKETIFFMDMRTQGKGFDKFYERAKREGIEFIRGKVYGVEELDGTGNLLLKYVAEDDKSGIREFDLVVLSVGFQPSLESIALAKKLRIQLNKYGFCYTDTFSPVETSRPGIFVSGAFQGPKDIPETVMQASGAGAKAASLLSPVRNTLISEKTYPPEKEVTGEEPRIGVFICHCGINIGAVVDVPKVVEYVRTLPNIAYAEDNLYTCSQDTQEKIKAMIKEHNLNRVVVASCSPRTHEPLFQETIREAGLNRYLFEMTNIRDQCSWVPRDCPEEATRKAKDLTKMVIDKARLIQPLEELTVPIIPKGLVIGGGIAGMIAALELANQGFECSLIEKSDELGGNARRVYYTLDGNNASKFLEETIQKVERNGLIHVYKNAEIKEVTGYIGNFKTTVDTKGEDEILEHGVIIVATGGREYRPSEYLYGRDERVITQLELEEKLATHSLKPEELNNVVMIQCIGSRTEERVYCSKVCCSQAIKNALKIKEINPFSNIYILYKDMRTYGFKEEFYQKARNQGVIFLRYTDENKPEVTSDNNGIKVKTFDPVLGEDLLIKPDLLVLSAGIVPNEDNEALAKMLKVPLNEDGFFLEAHVKLRPVDFATEGIFVCGLAHSPKPIEESLSQALAAAGKAAIPLSKGFVTVEPIVSSVNEEKCIGCGLCESICPFSAIRLVSKNGVKKAETIPASCKGCGLCAASCPQQAITMGHFTDEELRAQIGALVLA
jgi:heterodisulfide reductase subunit A